MAEEGAAALAAERARRQSALGAAQAAAQARPLPNELPALPPAASACFSPCKRVSTLLRVEGHGGAGGAGELCSGGGRSGAGCRGSPGSRSAGRQCGCLWQGPGHRSWRCKPGSRSHRWRATRSACGNSSGKRSGGRIASSRCRVPAKCRRRPTPACGEPDLLQCSCNEWYYSIFSLASFLPHPCAPYSNFQVSIRRRRELDWRWLQLLQPWLPPRRPSSRHSQPSDSSGKLQQSVG